jgi:hypothetical protein
MIKLRRRMESLEI